jgi:hypothetical protein
MRKGRLEMTGRFIDFNAKTQCRKEFSPLLSLLCGFAPSFSAARSSYQPENNTH